MINTSVPPIIRPAPKISFIVMGFFKKIKASIMVSATLSLSIGATCETFAML